MKELTEEWLPAPGALGITKRSEDPEEVQLHRNASRHALISVEMVGAFKP